jgi:16S rRNA (cytidine1402-2'-O)-methyltransferase
LLVALRDVAETLGRRPLSLSPLWAESDEAAWRGTVDEAVAHFEANPPHGEWALVIGGARGKAARWPEDRVQSELERLLVKGLGRKEAARLVAEVSGWRPREVYRLAAQG